MESTIRQIPPPIYNGGKYAYVPHSFVMDEVEEQLDKANFEIISREYNIAEEGKIVRMIYNIKSNDDETNIMFAWANSYNKKMSFKCSIGAIVLVCSNGMMKGDLANYKRKHIGKAKYDIINSIKNQIERAEVYYDSLIKDREMLKGINLTKTKKAEIAGRLLIDKKIITLTQLGIVKREIESPSHIYHNPDSAWDMYNHVTYALKTTHPLSYIPNHQKLHDIFTNNELWQ